MTDPALLIARTEHIATIGTVVAAIMTEFLAGNPEVVIFGPSEDTANGAPPSIYWMPLDEEWVPSKNRGAPDSPGSLFERWLPVSFMIFGGLVPNPTWTDDKADYHDCDMTERYMSRLVNAAHRTISPKSYRFKSFIWTPAGRTGIGMPGELTIAFHLPLVREDNPTISGITLSPVPEIAHLEDE